ncbi:MAG: YciI family protein [Acidimicrobiales bacterium]|nr:YciI family protein [Acidimicrobiales bacterium]
MSEFMLLIYEDPKALEDVTAEERAEMSSEYMAFSQELVDSGAMRGGNRLQGVDAAKTVGSASVTDGPFAETTEVLGGYYLIDVADADAAVAWAAKLPGVSRGVGKVEVRPVFDMSGMPS